LSVEVGAKRLELLHELLPNVKIVGLLVNPTSPLAEIETRNEKAAAGKLGLECVFCMPARKAISMESLQH
jgi:ABC-type uncharacterized transport system substrate-binding protein